jgi:hypothetical protein
LLEILEKSSTEKSNNILSLLKQQITVQANISPSPPVVSTGSSVQETSKEEFKVIKNLLDFIQTLPKQEEDSP